MRLGVAWLLLSMLSGSLAMWSQNSALQPSGKVAIGTPVVEDASEVVFVIPTTDLSFRYRPEFKPEDPKSLNRRSYRMIYQLHPEDDPNRIGADPCSPILLAAGIDDEAEQRLITGKKFHATPPTGGMTLVDLDRKCLPGKSDEDARWMMLDRLRGIDGLKPVSQGVSYKLDGHPAALAVVQGFSKDETGKRVALAGMTLIGAVSLIYEGHLLYWTFIANDPDVFNHLLKSRVQFAGKPSWPLVPFELGIGDEQKAVPK